MSSPEVGTYVAGLHPVRVNPEHSGADAELAGAFRVGGFPSVYLIARPGARPVKIPIPADLTPAGFITKLKRASGENS